MTTSYGERAGWLIDSGIAVFMHPLNKLLN